MPLKIFHTADIHLGMKFSSYPEDIQGKLTEARYNTLQRLVDCANSESCTLFVVAGDLFDRVNVNKKDIKRCTDILSEFQGDLVAVLPGNHDYIAGQSELWSSFRHQAGDRVLLLDEKRPYELGHYDIDAVLYPAPCDKKHSHENGIGWIQDTGKVPEKLYHIGIAHGNLEGLGFDEEHNYFPMTKAELSSCKMDAWLLGHIHVQYPDPEKVTKHDRIFYPATPEADGFDCRHTGRAWILELQKDKSIVAVSQQKGTHRFAHEENEIARAEDIEKIQDRFSNSDCAQLLLKLKLGGHLPKADFPAIESLRRTLEDHLLFLQWNNDVVAEITTDAIDQEFTQGSFPHRLLHTLTGDESDREALQIVYDLIQEIKDDS